MRYRKPRSINWVTFMLLGTAGLFVYLAVYLWPVYSARSRVRGIMLDHIPALYRANLLPPDATRTLIGDLKNSMRAEMQKAGINEKSAKLYVRHNAKELEIEVRFKAKARFPWPDKTFEFDLAPKVVSDATRVEW